MNIGGCSDNVLYIVIILIKTIDEIALSSIASDCVIKISENLLSPPEPPSAPPALSVREIK